jgi:hypothetical protein
VKDANPTDVKATGLHRRRWLFSCGVVALATGDCATDPAIGQEHLGSQPVEYPVTNPKTGRPFSMHSIIYIIGLVVVVLAVLTLIA